MAELVLTQAEQDEVSQLRCQVSMLTRKVEQLTARLDRSDERELTLRRQIQDLSRSKTASGVNPDLKKKLDLFLDQEGRYSGGWVSFVAIRGKFELKPSRWSQIKSALLEGYPDDYEESERDDRTKVFRHVI